MTTREGELLEAIVANREAKLSHAERARGGVIPEDELLDLRLEVLRAKLKLERSKRCPS